MIAFYIIFFKKCRKTWSLDLWELQKKFVLCDILKFFYELPLYNLKNTRTEIAAFIIIYKGLLQFLLIMKNNRLKLIRNGL